MNINDGDLLVELRADISGLRNSLNQASQVLQSFSSSVGNIEKQIQSQTAMMGASFGNIAKAMTSASAQITSDTTRVVTSITGLNTTFSTASKGVSASIVNMQGSIGKLPTTLADVARRVSGSTGAINSGFRGLRSDIALQSTAINGSLTSIGSKMDALASKMVNVRTQITRQGNLTRDALTQINTTLNRQTQALSDSIKLSGKGISDSIRAGIRDMGEFGNSTQGANRHASTLLGTFKQFAINTYIIRAFMEFMVNSMASIVMPGIRFAASMEQTALGMAGILTSMTKVNGVETTFEQGLAISQGLMEKIKDAALITSMTTAEMSKVFMSGLAPGMKAFANDVSSAGVGMTTLEKIMDFTIVASNAVRSMGLPAQQVTQEMRSLLGSAPIRTANDFLATTLGYTTETLKNLKAQGLLYGDLMDRMKGFDQASKMYAGTLDGLMSNLRDGFERLSGMGLNQLFEKSKDSLKQFTDKYLFTIKYIQTENGKVRPLAIINPNTIKMFEKIGAVSIGLYSIFSGLLSIVEPIISALGNLAYELFTMFTKVFVVVLPIFEYLGTQAGYAIGYLTKAIAYLNEHVVLVTGFIVALAVANMANVVATWLSTSATMAGTAAFWAKVHAIVATTGATMKFVAAQALLLIKYVAIIAIVMALIGVFLAMKFAYQDCIDGMLEISLMFQAGWEGMIATVKWYWEGFILLFTVGMNKIKEGMNSVFGTKYEMTSLDMQKNKMDEQMSNLKTSYSNMTSMMGAVADRTKTIGKKIADGVKSSMSFDVSGMVKKMMSGNDVSLRFPNEPKGTKDTKANGISKANSAKDIAQIEADRKSEVEALKVHLKNLDYLYSQHEISLIDYYDKYRDTERAIAQIELETIAEKIVVATLEAEQLKGLGDLAGAIKQETDVIKLSGEAKARSSVLQEKLIDLNRKEANAINNQTKELAGLNAEHEKHLGHLSNAAKIEADQKYDKKIAELTTETLSAVARVNTQVKDKMTGVLRAPTNKEKADLEAEVIKFQTGLSQLISAKGVDVSKGLYSEAKQAYDFINNDLSNAINAVNVEAKNGKISEANAQQQVIDLQRAYAKEMDTIIPKLRLYATMIGGAEGERLIQQVNGMTNALKEQSEQIDYMNKQIKDGWTSSLTSFFETGILKCKTFGDVMKGVFKGVFEELNKLLAKNLSSQLVNTPLFKGITGMAGGLAGKTSKASTNGNGALQQSGNSAITAGLSKVNKDFLNLSKNTKNIITSGNLLDTSFKTNIATTKAGQAIETVGQALDEAGNIVQETTSMILEKTFISLSIAATQAATALAAVKLTAATGGYIKKFSNGGSVFGAGTSTSDDIDAKLSDGEYVVRAASVKKYGVGYLNAINSGILPPMKFAEGGSVSNSGKTGDSVGNNTKGNEGMTQHIQVSFNPVFQSLDPAENGRQFEKQFPMFKQKMLEAIQSEPATRNVIRRANK